VFALTAGQEDLHGHPVAGRHAPSFGGLRTDLLDDADGLVAGDEGIPRVEKSGVLLMIRTAETAGLDPEDGVIRPDRWQRKGPTDEPKRLLEHERSCLTCHGLTILSETPTAGIGNARQLD
jgi:hypothetical protein